MGKLDNKVAIITGGNAGVGKEIAKLFASEGAKVVISARRQQVLEEAAKEIEAAGGTVLCVPTDISKVDDVKNLVSKTVETFGQLDILINNAGISLTGLFTDVTDEEWNKIINNDLYSVFCTTQEVLTNMIMRKEGCIINISSIWGQIGASMEVVYSISKAGVDGLTKALAKELGPSNIRVNSIAPGIIDTEMNNCYSAEEIEAIKEEIPLERIGKKGDISKCIEWLIEDDYITGQIISINGGWSI